MIEALFPEMANQGRFDQENKLISESMEAYKIYANIINSIT